MDIKKLSLNTILNSENLAEEFSEEERNKIALHVKEGYDMDVQSRKEWEDRMDKAMKLALQVAEEKTFPWPKCANIKFPLITIAAIQYSSRAYAALVPDYRVVKMRVVGQDPNNEKHVRAESIAQHMSYQLLEQDEGWQEDHERLLISQSIMGSAFKKSYFDSYKGHNVSEMVHSWDLVVDYYARSIETASRVTHVLYRTPNEIKERMRGGIFIEFDLESSYETTSADQTRDEVRGRTRPANDPSASQMLLEQHNWMDLDQDGYAEPYVVTYHVGTGKLVRIVRRFEGDNILYRKNRVCCITPHQYFTKYGFIPSPDGGFYDLGFGALLGPINESVNTAVNQLFDAGTMANTGGGFLGRGIRMRGGKLSFKPNEWKKLEISGDDIRKNIFPLPIRDPSQVLFQLLGLLIQYGERIGSVSDLMVGESPGQNQPATTSMAVLDQGMKVFTGIFKRTFRYMTEEFRKLFILNQKFLNPEEYYDILDKNQQDEQGIVYLDDYKKGDPKDIRPAADPEMVADSQRLLQAEALAQRAASVPGYNQALVEKKYLEAMKIQDIDQVFPLDEQGNPKIPPPPNPEVQTKMAELEFEREKFQWTQHKDIATLEMEGAKLDAEIQKLESTAILNAAKAESEQSGPQLEQLKLFIENIKSQRENITQQLGVLHGMARLEASSGNGANAEVAS